MREPRPTQEGPKAIRPSDMPSLQSKPSLGQNQRSILLLHLRPSPRKAYEMLNLQESNQRSHKMRSLMQARITSILRIEGNFLNRVKLIQKLESMHAHLRLPNKLHGSHLTKNP